MWHRITARLSEPSTWAAIGAALGALGFYIPNDLAQGITYAGCGISIILGIVLPEGT